MAQPAWLLPTQMLHAINTNDQQRAARTLEQGLDCDHRVLYGSKTWPLLCMCADRGHTELVGLLISWGCSVNQSDSSGATALHISAYQGRRDIVQLLLSHRANRNALNHHRQTPLHRAAERGSPDVVETLLEAGADLDPVDDRGMTPLMYACQYHHLTVARQLLEAGASLRPLSLSADSALHLACRSGAAEADRGQLVTQLVAGGASTEARNRQGATPLHLALTEGHRLTAAALLRSGADPDSRTRLGQCPLQLAAGRRLAQLVRLLLVSGARPQQRDGLGHTPLALAARDGDLETVRLLLAVGARERDWRQAAEPEVRERLRLAAVNVPQLTDLCRRSVLTALAGCRDSENAVNSLPLPPRLRRFLQLHIIEM